MFINTDIISQSCGPVQISLSECPAANRDYGTARLSIVLCFIIKKERCCHKRRIEQIYTRARTERVQLCLSNMII